MQTFEEMMEQFRNPGENGIPETFADDLAAVHAEELSIRDAAVKSREQDAADLRAQLDAAELEKTRLKGINYDLLMAAPKPGEKVTPENGDNNDGDRPRGVASLFVKEND